MTGAEFKHIREAIGWTQVEMAERLDVSRRQIIDIEAGEAVRTVYSLAVGRLALAAAIERGNPMLAPASIRREALELARMITG